MTFTWFLLGMQDGHTVLGYKILKFDRLVALVVISVINGASILKLRQETPAVSGARAPADLCHQGNRVLRILGFSLTVYAFQALLSLLSSRIRF